MPVTMMDRHMHGKTSICESFPAWRAPVQPGLHMSVPQMALHVIFSLNRLAAEDTSKSYITLLHLCCHQSLQLRVFII